MYPASAIFRLYPESKSTSFYTYPEVGHVQLLDTCIQ